MTEQEKQLANSILETQFSPLDVVRIIVDLKQTDSDQTPVGVLYQEFEQRVLLSHKYKKPVFSFHIEKLLRTFFWETAMPFFREYEKDVVNLITTYPKFYTDDFMQDYDEWSFNLADHIQEVLNIPYSWIDDETEQEQNNG